MTVGHLRKLFHLITCRMSSATYISLTPVGVRGMKHLDRDKFLRNVTVPVLKVSDAKVSSIVKTCKPYFLKLENSKAVQNIDADSDASIKKCFYLSPEKVKTWNDISETDRLFLGEHGVTEEHFDTQEIQLGYENFKSDAIFKAVLPEKEEIVSGFSQIGHIIHLNLKDHLLEYRSLIGEVLLDKIKTCRTVVNKSNVIDNTYRNFAMEVIAGEEDFLVTVKENRCNFQFDFSKVYWNPRLGMEHERIIMFLKEGDVLFDVFCGVGPFSIPAAKRKCKVFANDLNPDSYKWLNHNATHNKVDMSLFKSYNLDGKDFICDNFKNFISNLCSGKEKLENNAKIHVTMNLPAMAVEFLKYFNGLIDRNLIDNFNCEIIVYVYCFVTGEDCEDAAKKMVMDNIGRDISSYIIDVFDVRNVSPKKEMMRVTFKLTNDVLFKSAVCHDCEQEPPEKKLCVDSVNK